MVVEFAVHVWFRCCILKILFVMLFKFKNWTKIDRIVKQPSTNISNFLKIKIHSSRIRRKWYNFVKWILDERIQIISKKILQKKQDLSNLQYMHFANSVFTKIVRIFMSCVELITKLIWIRGRANYNKIKILIEIMV